MVLSYSNLLAGKLGSAWKENFCSLLNSFLFFSPPINNSTLRIWFFGLTIFIASVFSVNGLMAERLQIIWFVSLFCLSACPELKSIKNSNPMGKNSSLIWTDEFCNPVFTLNQRLKF